MINIHHSKNLKKSIFKFEIKFLIFEILKIKTKQSLSKKFNNLI